MSYSSSTQLGIVLTLFLLCLTLFYPSYTTQSDSNVISNADQLLMVSSGCRNTKTQIDFKSLYEDWKKTYIGEGFSTPMEDLYRFKVFSNNVINIYNHNFDQTNPYQMGLNQFAHLTPQQFKDKYLQTFTISNHTLHQKYIVQSSLNYPTIDWTQKGVVSPVINTGAMCAASWVQAVAGSVESAFAISTGNLIKVSAQQIIDCSDQYGNKGCSQGTMVNSLQYVKNKGITSSAQYPSTFGQGQCKKPEGSAQFKISGYESLKNQQTCLDLWQMLSKGPVGVYVDASHFMFYTSGIFNNCGNNVNLAVLLVGSGEGFWKLKLNWGSSWGQNGYIRISQGNSCAVCQYGYRAISNPNHKYLQFQ